MELPSQADISVKDLLLVLEAHGFHPDLRRYRFLPYGRRNINIFMEAATGEKFSLRVFGSRAQAQRDGEEKTLGWLEDHPPQSIRIPRVQGKGELPDAGLPYLLLSWLEGKVPGRGFRWVPQEQQEPLAYSWGKTLAHLHEVPLPRPGFGPFWEGEAALSGRPFEEEEFARRVARAQGEGFLGEGQAFFARRFVEAHLDYLEKDEAPVFCHQDLHGENVLYEGEGHEVHVAAFLDFEHARARFPELDWVMPLWSLPPDGTLWEEGKLGALRGAFVAGYRSVRGLHPRWRERLLLAEMIKAVGFLMAKEAYIDFLHENRQKVQELLRRWDRA
ncbi:MAG: aminoglycoside phosphotransferase family protein [Bacillota bacterium]|nr:aminoglycoside phosphotransferase family protein [Bacillota bacterium]